MPESQLILIFGDAYRCQEALESRNEMIHATDSNVEQHRLFGDEIEDVESHVNRLDLGNGKYGDSQRAVLRGASTENDSLVDRRLILPSRGQCR